MLELSGMNMSLENIMIWFWKKKFQKKKKFELRIQPPNLEWTSDFQHEAISTLDVTSAQVTLLLDKLSLINTILVNNIVIIIIIYEIFECSCHVLKAYSNKNVML